MLLSKLKRSSVSNQTSLPRRMSSSVPAMALILVTSAHTNRQLKWQIVRRLETHVTSANNNSVGFCHHHKVPVLYNMYMWYCISYVTNHQLIKCVLILHNWNYVVDLPAALLVCKQQFHSQVDKYHYGTMLWHHENLLSQVCVLSIISLWNLAVVCCSIKLFTIILVKCSQLTYIVAMLYMSMH